MIVRDALRDARRQRARGISVMDEGNDARHAVEMFEVFDELLILAQVVLDVVVAFGLFEDQRE